MASICFVFFFDNRDWRILHSLLELTWLKRVRDLIQSIIQDYNNDEQEKYINLYKLIKFIMEDIIIFHETITKHGGPFGYTKLILTLNCIKE